MLLFFLRLKQKRMRSKELEPKYGQKEISLERVEERTAN